MLMLVSSLVFFALAAVVGLTLAGLHWTGKNVSVKAAMVHGVPASIGLFLLIAFLIQRTPANHAPLTSLIIFILAAMGGAALVFMHARGRPLPKYIIVTHGLVALIAFLNLLFYTVRLNSI